MLLKPIAISTFLTATISLTSATAQSVGITEAPDALENAPWNNRLLVVCLEEDADPDDGILREQYDTADWKGYLERDLILVWLTTKDAMTWKPVPHAYKDATLLIGLHNPETTGLAERTGCGEEFDFISLIGKDGSVKARWENVIPNKSLFNIIDAMPMRKSEIRNNR